MKELHFRIFKGEKSNVFKQKIEADLFDFLNIMFIVNLTKIVSPEINKRINLFGERLYDLQYDIIYNILENVSGISTTEIEDLTIEDYLEDKIIIHVYLD